MNRQPLAALVIQGITTVVVVAALTVLTYVGKIGGDTAAAIFGGAVGFTAAHGSTALGAIASAFGSGAATTPISTPDATPAATIPASATTPDAIRSA